MQSNHEHDIVANLTANPQSTHNQVAANSIAMTVLQLRDYYLGKAPTQAIMDEHYEACINTLNAFQVGDFFKPHEIDDPHNDKLKQDITDNLASVIASLIARTHEPIVPEFDIVTLYLKDDAGSFHEEIIQLPLKEVLPLLMKAYLDDAKFANQYEGTLNEQIQQAHDDRPLRLLTLFRCCQRVKMGICHTGIRNELGLLLNGIYEGIHIIEDTAATVTLFLKEYINQRFWDYYATLTHDSSEAKALLDALFEWMTTQNPTSVLSIVDPEHQIKAAITGYFIQHGSNPHQLIVKHENEQITFDSLIERLSSRLAFASDTKHHAVFSMIDTLLNADTTPGRNVSTQEEHNQAVSKIQMWIKQHFTLNSLHDAQTVSDFYTIYHTEQQLKSYKPILILTQRMTSDEVQGLLQNINDYYRDVLASTEAPLPRPSAVFKFIKELHQTIKACKEDNLSDKIENFFGLWFTGVNTEDISTVRALYGLLLDVKSRKKILMDDYTIQTLNNENTIKEHGTTFRNMTPYEINRVFLHAILQKPDEWSPLYTETLQNILSFVKQGFEASNSLAQSLKQGSYPKKLMDQLDYLQAMRVFLTEDHHENQHTKPIRPVYMIVLPEHIRTAKEWIGHSCLFDDERRESVYQSMQAFLQPLLINIILDEESLIDALYSLPEKRREPFLALLGREKLNTLLVHMTDLLSILQLLPEESYQAFVTTIGNGKIPAALSGHESRLIELFMHLSTGQFTALLATFSDEVSNYIFRDEFQLRFYLNRLPEEHYSSFLTAVGDERINAIINEVNLDEFLKVLTDAQYNAFVTNVIGNKIICKYISSAEGLNTTLRALPTARYKTLFTALGDEKITDILKFSHRYEKALTYLSVAQQKEFFMVMSYERVSAVIKDERDLSRVMSNMQDDSKIAFLTGIGYEKVRAVILGHNLSFILRFVPVTYHETFLTTFGHDNLRSMIKNGAQLAAILGSWSKAERLAFLNMLGDEKINSLIHYPQNAFTPANIKETLASGNATVLAKLTLQAYGNLGDRMIRLIQTLESSGRSWLNFYSTVSQEQLYSLVKFASKLPQINPKNSTMEQVFAYIFVGRSQATQIVRTFDKELLLLIKKELTDNKSGDAETWTLDKNPI